jgi:hypothetical protein
MVWALLKARDDGRWEVTGGAMKRDFFFEGATKKDLRAYLDPTKYRIVDGGSEVRVGAIVALSEDGARVIWTPKAPPR